MRHPQLQHIGQRTQARARVRQGVAHMLGMVKRQVQQPAVGAACVRLCLTGAQHVVQVAPRVVCAEHFHLHLRHGRAALHQQAAKVTHPGAVAQHVQRGLIACQHIAAVHGDALGAPQHVARAGLQGSGHVMQRAGQQGAQDVCHHAVQHHRRVVHRTAAQHTEVARLQRARLQQRITKAQKYGVVFARISVLHAGQRFGAHRMRGVFLQALIQCALGGA